MKNLRLVLALLVFCAPIVFGNGGAWQTGIIGTGNVRNSNKDRHTDVTIENENVNIDLHRERAAVEVRYRMHNTGPVIPFERNQTREVAIHYDARYVLDPPSESRITR